MMNYTTQTTNNVLPAVWPISNGLGRECQYIITIGLQVGGLNSITNYILKGGFILLIQEQKSRSNILLVPR